MPDIMLPEQRSKLMSRIKSKDTSIEIVLRKALWKKGYRFRKNYKNLPGTPDIALIKYKIAIFCDGEFFHGYQWEIKKTKIVARREYWIRKIERNMMRDKENDLALLAMGWSVIHFWGHEIVKHTARCIQAIEEIIFELQVGEVDDMIFYDIGYLDHIK